VLRGYNRKTDKCTVDLYSEWGACGGAVQTQVKTVRVSPDAVFLPNTTLKEQLAQETADLRMASELQQAIVSRAWAARQRQQEADQAAAVHTAAEARERAVRHRAMLQEKEAAAKAAALDAQIAQDTQAAAVHRQEAAVADAAVAAAGMDKGVPVEKGRRELAVEQAAERTAARAADREAARIRNAARAAATEAALAAAEQAGAAHADGLTTARAAGVRYDGIHHPDVRVVEVVHHYHAVPAPPAVIVGPPSTPFLVPQPRFGRGFDALDHAADRAFAQAAVLHARCQAGLSSGAHPRFPGLGLVRV
jgi:hypothetical protein